MLNPSLRFQTSLIKMEAEARTSLKDLLKTLMWKRKRTVSFCVPQYWNDYYLQWNTSEYPGVTNVRFPDHLIWKPDILLYNR